VEFQVKLLNIVLPIFGLIGIGMLGGAGYSYNNTNQFIDQSIKTDGIVVDLVRSHSIRSRPTVSGSSSRKLRRGYSPVVEFTTESGDTVEFVSSTSSNPPDFTEGELVEVFYDPKSPRKAKINSFLTLWAGTIIVGFLGLNFSAIGIGWSWNKVKKKRRVKQLRQSGYPIQARVTSMEINSGVKVNGRRPYRISAQWLDSRTSTVHTFFSENIWYDPAEFVSNDEITVLIERENPKHYLMDVSSLPKSDMS
jgi:hypothetical protein